MGGSHHPLLNVLGVMSAKNTAVNIMILTTFLSFLLYRRANKRPTVAWARTGTMIQGLMFALAAAVVLFYGVYGYFVEAIVRIGFSVYQVGAVLTCIVGVTVIDIALGRNAESRGEIRWGQIPDRSQYALFVIAVTFTWLMGLMGFARSGIRQHWHVWEVMPDTSPYAATPALGYAANMISACVVIFLTMVAFIFWLGGLAEKAAHRSRRRGPEAMWATNLKVVAVALVVIGFYTTVAHIIPQLESEVPEAVDLSGGVTPEALVAAGERLFNGAGGCTACHGLGTRAPNLLTDHAGEGTIGVRCATREPGKDCKAYLYESLTEPAAYVVKGFDVLMPDMRRLFSSEQIWALVAFLESQGGQVTVTAEDIKRTGGAAGGLAAAAAGAAPAAGERLGASCRGRALQAVLRRLLRSRRHLPHRWMPGRRRSSRPAKACSTAPAPVPPATAPASSPRTCSPTTRAKARSARAVAAANRARTAKPISTSR